MYTKTAAVLFMAVAGAASIASAQNDPGSGYFAWDVPSQTYPAYTPSPFLANNAASAADVEAQLAAAQAAGQTLAVKIVEPLTNSAAIKVFDDYAVKYVFADYEGSGRVGQTKAVGDIVASSAKSSGAFVGNFNAYLNAGNDTTRPGSLSASAAPSFTSRPNSMDYYQAQGRADGSPTNNGKQVADPALYPGSPDYRNPASGDSNAPNIRSALFTLPIQRMTFSTNGLLNRGVPNPGSQFYSATNAYGTPATGYTNGAKNIPYVTRFNNYGNSHLDSDGNSSNGYEFVQNAATPSNGQLLSRGDFEAMILHYRLRGADSTMLFNEANGSVVGYSDAQEHTDVQSGWNASGTAGGAVVNGIFARKNYAFANLTNVIGDSGGDSGDTKTVSTEKAGAVWSGVFDRSGSSRHLAILLSNLSNSQKVIDLPNKIGGFQTARGDGVRMDDFFLNPGQHKLVTFTLSGSSWRLDSGINLNGNAIVFTDDNRNGVGIPEPTSLAVLGGMAGLGLLTRRRRSAKV